jgi:predicted Rossmann fold nucleotide-binding protein DprA/Smf involved in DNA uptake
MTLVPETPTEQLLWDHISAEPIHIDDLMRETLLSPAEVSGTLSVMEIKVSSSA